MARMACVIVLLGVALTVSSPAQTFTSLASFDSTNGARPQAPLAQGPDGNLYGTTSGTAFRVTPSGAISLLHTFCTAKGCAGGNYPLGELLLSPNGSFYGTASSGGVGPGGGNGTVFEMATVGTVWTIHSFSGGADGTRPRDGLVQAPNANFYGTTSEGGGFGDGTAFELTPGGVLTALQQFGNGTNGSEPYAGLTQGSDGNFYGATAQGGTSGFGTVFKLTPGGTLSVLHNFDGTDGSFPASTLVQATDGNFYGTTNSGGNSSCVQGCGTIFKITPAGTFKVLHSFDGTDGEYPQAGLMQATDGYLYGTTSPAFTSTACPGVSCGTIFRITLAGAFQTVHTFSGSDGSIPVGGLMQSTNGILYGTTELGGTSTNPNCQLNDFGCGTIYSLSIGAAPFVQVLPPARSVGQNVIILGNNLTGATSVTFNGVSATFTVKSATEIRATVPSGATTGTVEVTTPSGTLKSNIRFQVRE
jgi:uncharacterized repeat protein (TIGR03803 family)